MFDQIMAILMGSMALGVVLAAWRLVAGPTPPDRIVALDMLMVQAVGLLALHAIVTDQPLLLDVIVGMSIAGVLGLVAVARFIEGGGR